MITHKKLAVLARNSVTGSAAVILCLGYSGCGSSSSTPAASSDLAVTGTMGTSSGANALFENRSQSLGRGDRAAIDYSTMSVNCATLATPPVAATGKVGSDGSFSVTLPGGLNQPMNCSLLDASGNLAASIVTSDTVHTNMNGNPTTADTMAFSGSAGLGSVTYNPNTGEATVPIAHVSGSLETTTFSPSVAFDPTGIWVIGAVSFPLPDGVLPPCASQHDNNCNGPPLNQAIYLKRYAGVSTSDETTPVYGFQVWQDRATATSCGDVLGLSTAQATALGIDFSSNGAAVTPFTFVSSYESNALTNGYQLANATTAWEQQLGCGSQTITVGGVSYSGWVCGPDGQGYYQASLGGGCVDSTGTAVNTQGSYTNTGQCTTTALGGGYFQQSCPGTYNSTVVTCSNTSGTFTDAGLTTPVSANGAASTTASITSGSPTMTVTSSAGLATGQVISGNNGIPSQNNSTTPTISAISGDTITMSENATNTATGVSVTFGSYFNFNSLSTIASGTSCSSLTPGSLIQEQCYAQFYQNSTLSQGGSDACAPQINTDWSQTDPAKFVTVSWTPNGLVLMNQLTYFSATSAGTRNEQDQVRGVQSSAGNNQMVNCHTHEVDSLSFKEVDATHMIATYAAATTTSDTGLPDCVANFGNTTSKFLFELTQQ